MNYFKAYMYFWCISKYKLMFMGNVLGQKPPTTKATPTKAIPTKATSKIIHPDKIHPNEIQIEYKIRNYFDYNLNFKHVIQSN